MKQKAGRRKKGYAASELQSDAKLAQEMGMSIPKLNRYIHLSEAAKGVCDLVDDGKLTVSVASEIAYLKKGTRESVLHLIVVFRTTLIFRKSAKKDRPTLL